MEVFTLEALGFAAGATNLYSSVPQLVANFRNPELVRGQNVSRNCYQFAGNALWLAYGLSAGSVSMTVFAGLGCAMAGALCTQTLKVNRTGPLARSRHTVAALRGAAA